MSLNRSERYEIPGQVFDDNSSQLPTVIPANENYFNACATKEVLLHVKWIFEDFPPPPYWAHVIVGVIMSCIGIVAIVGNLFIIYIFTRFRSLRTAGNVLVPNLALADGMLALTGFPLYIISSFYGRWVFGTIGCRVYGMCGAAFGLMSINTLAAIAYERYLVIVKSYPTARNASKKHVAALLLVVWINSFTWAIAPNLGWNRYILEGYGTTCSFDYITRNPSYTSLVMTMFSVGFLLPLALIMYCYIYIIAFVHHSERHLTATSAMMDAHLWRGARKICRRTELKIARTVILNVFFFCISWLPYSVIALIGQFGDQTMLSPILSVIPGILAKMSTMYNPFIYCFSHPRIKQKVRLFFKLSDRTGSAKTDTMPRENRISLHRVALETNMSDATNQGPNRFEESYNASSIKGIDVSKDIHMPYATTANHEAPSLEKLSRTSKSSSSRDFSNYSEVRSQCKSTRGSEGDSYKNSSSYHSCSSGSGSKMVRNLETYTPDTAVPCWKTRFVSTYRNASFSVSSNKSTKMTSVDLNSSISDSSNGVPV